MTDNPWDDLKSSDNSNSSSKKNKSYNDDGFFHNVSKNTGENGDDTILEKFNDFSNFFSSKFKIKSSLNGFLLAVFAVLFFWLLSGIYIVKQEESAIVMRFGKYSRTANAGLHYHLPTPIETIVKEATTRVRMLKIGGDNSAKNNLSDGWALTGDENIVNLELNVQWKIDDLKKFVFNVRDKQQTIYDATQSAIREVISKRKLADILTSGRSDIEEETKQLLQQMLDTYDIGISVLLVQMLKIDPPSQVLDSFRDVQTARVDKESEINKAYKYKNNVLPKVKGEAGKILQDANGYAIAVVNRAKGDASRFNQIHQQYKNAPFVTRKRMYLDAIEAIFKGKGITIVDENVKNVFLNSSKEKNAETQNSDGDVMKNEEIAQLKDLEENNN